MTTPNSQKKRGKSFTNAENKQLCLSWIQISEDPIKGTDQSLTVFWSAVHQDAMLRLDSFVSRTPDGLRQRWGVVSRTVSKFSSCYKNIIRLNESGTNDEDKLKKALDLYKRDYHEDFNFLECWEILKKSPKFSIENQEGRSSTPCNTSISSEGACNSRPPGRNSAKSALKLNEMETRRIEALEKIAKATEKKTKLFAEYTETMKQDSVIKLAAIRLVDLDPTSAELIKLQREALLKKMRNETSGERTSEPRTSELRTSQSHTSEPQFDGNQGLAFANANDGEEWLDTEERLQRDVLGVQWDDRMDSEACDPLMSNDDNNL